MKLYLTDFAKGIIAGAVAATIIACVIFWAVFIRNKNKELIEYVEKQIEIENLREDIINRSPDEFLEAIPDVRGAVDGASAGFERKRDEIMERFRNRIAD